MLVFPPPHAHHIKTVINQQTRSGGSTQASAPSLGAPGFTPRCCTAVIKTCLTKKKKKKTCLTTKSRKTQTMSQPAHWRSQTAKHVCVSISTRMFHTPRFTYFIIMGHDLIQLTHYCLLQQDCKKSSESFC